MRRVVSTVAAAILVLGVAACGGAEPEESTTATPSSTSPTTSAPEPTWSATAKPERPVDEQSPEGAEAFARYVADLVFYMMATSDVPALTSVADMSLCDRCREWNENHSQGRINKKTIASGRPTYRLAAEPIVTDDVYYQVRLEMDVPAGREVVARSDGTTEKRKIAATKGLDFKVDMVWKGDRWELQRYQMG